MNKNELVSAVAEKAGLTKADAASAVDAVFETVQGELKNGGDIRWPASAASPSAVVKPPRAVTLPRVLKSISRLATYRSFPQARA